MKIHIGADHAGFELKGELIKHLEGKGYEVVDHGANEYDEEDDYPDFVKPTVEAVVEGLNKEEIVRGIVIGGSGQGEAICANRYVGIRATVFNGQYEPVNESGDLRDVPNEIVISRTHNDSNVLSLGARFLSVQDAVEAVDLWLETAFSEDERHLRRIRKIDE